MTPIQFQEIRHLKSIEIVNVTKFNTVILPLVVRTQTRDKLDFRFKNPGKLYGSAHLVLKNDEKGRQERKNMNFLFK